MSDLRGVLEKVGRRIEPREDAFDRLERARRRRTRNRKITAGALAAAIAVSGIVGVSVAFLGGEQITPGGQDGRVVALWPEQTMAEIRRTQDAVDAGEESLAWRLDLEATAKRFVEEVLGWGDAIVTIQLFPGDGQGAVAEITTPAAPCPTPAEGEPIDPRCPGRKVEVSLVGLLPPQGVWSVLRVEGDRIRFDPETADGLSVDETVRAHVDLPAGAQALGGGTFFGDGCTNSFSTETIAESGVLRLSIPTGECAVTSGYVFAYVVGPGSAGFDEDPMDAEQLYAPDPFGQRVEVLDLTAMRVNLGPTPDAEATSLPEETPTTAEESPPPDEEAVPDVAEVVCDPSVTQYSPIRVRPQPDGVHIRVTNGLDRQISVMIDDFGSEKVEALGSKERVESIPPGETWLRCYDPENAGPDADPAPFVRVLIEVADPDGLWKSTELECASDTILEGILDYFAGARGVQDPLEAARTLDGILPTDAVELARYPESEPPMVRVVRDGKVVALFEYIPDGHGGWLLSGTESCGDVGIG